MIIDGERERLMELIIIGAVLAVLIIWSMTIRRRMAAMDENINSAMGQLGVQLASQTDALDALIGLTLGYADRESGALLESARERCCVITATSDPEEVRRQEKLIRETLECIFLVAEQHPALKADADYIRYRNAADSYGRMVCTGALIYNDSVAKLNRELRVFPVSLAAGLFGFHRREYLETGEGSGTVSGL